MTTTPVAINRFCKATGRLSILATCILALAACDPVNSDRDAQSRLFHEMQEITMPFWIHARTNPEAPYSDLLTKARELSRDRKAKMTHYEFSEVYFLDNEALWRELLNSPPEQASKHDVWATPFRDQWMLISADGRSYDITNFDESAIKKAYIRVDD